MFRKLVIFIVCAILSAGMLNVQADQMGEQLLAIQLANLGYQKKDSLLLMTAAKIFKTSPVQAISLNKQGAKNSKTMPKIMPKNKRISYLADDLLNTAEQYSKGKAELVLLIQELRSFTARGLSDGAKMHKDQVLANGFDYYKLSFEADAMAKVGIVSDDSQQDLDLYVVEALDQDKIVCQDTSATSGSLCEWVPEKEQDYIIKIKNRSSSMTAYTMILN